MKKSLLISVLLSTVLVSNASAAWGKMNQTQDISIGGQIGLFGIGINAKYKIDDKFGVRAGFDRFTLDSDTIKDLIDTEKTTSKEIELDSAELKIQDFNALVDWHPWGGSFRTSAGLFVNSSEITGTFKPSDQATFEFEGYTFSAKEVGSIDVLTDFDPVAPYIGIGGDTSFDKDKGFGFTWDLGVVIQGSPTIKYTPHYNSQLNDSRLATVKKELEVAMDKAKKTAQDDLDDLKVLPYYSIGFNYKF